MYAHLLAIVDRLFGSFGRHLLWLLPLLVVISFAMLLIPAWRKRQRAAWQGEVKFSFLTLLLSAVIRLLLIGSIVGVLAAALFVQRGLFSEKHGQITQRNYEAVRTKWGVPHEQRDLSVQHFAMRRVIVEELADGSTRERPLEERQPAIGSEERLIISEEQIPAPPEEEAERNPKRLVRRTTLWQRQRLEHDAIDSAQVSIELKSNPRTLGNATYAGYEDTWELAYTVRNRSEYAAQALFRFPLPADGYGVFDRLTVTLDGQDWLPKTSYRGGSLQWQMIMAADERHELKIGYASRGLEYFRYKPTNMLQRCLVTANVEGIESRRLDYPIGSMPPIETLAALSGTTYSLHWDLSRAVTNLDIGIKLPSPEQPGYYITRLLYGAPLALALLAAALFVTRWLIARRFDLLQVALVLLAFYVSHALLGNLNDVVRSFAAAFAISILPIVAVVTLFWCKVDGYCGFLGAQSSVLFALFAVFYPLASLSETAGGTLLHFLYAALTVYAVSLVAWNAAGTTCPHDSSS